jgi:hypothetical protein
VIPCKSNETKVREDIGNWSEGSEGVVRRFDTDRMNRPVTAIVRIEDDTKNHKTMLMKETHKKTRSVQTWGREAEKEVLKIGSGKRRAYNKNEDYMNNTKKAGEAVAFLDAIRNNMINTG